MAAEAEITEKDPHALSDALRAFFEEKYRNRHSIKDESYRTAMGNVESALEGNPNVMRLDHHKMKDLRQFSSVIAPVAPAELAAMVKASLIEKKDNRRGRDRAMERAFSFADSDYLNRFFRILNKFF